MISAVNVTIKQLEGRSLKNIRASTGFEPVTSVTPWRCSTNSAVKPHIESEVNLLSSYLPLQWNDVKALIFFKLLPSNCLKWNIYCDDHSSLTSTTAVQYDFHIYFTLTRLLCTARMPLISSIIKFSTSDNAFGVLWLVHSILVIRS